MLYFLDEASGQESTELLADCLLPLHVEAVEALLHRLCLDFYVEAVLNNLAEDARHIGGFPREDISVLV
jgi:hypothetical protein